ncbi:SusC/RagA family TonB-linked outer membrane protein [Sphingobacterium siyangense subsp. cladoniae]|uniref:SusC/RagA family TonB-linked outer membrane protein n=1 Tax=Sphingobacterium siyangense TaxID=459529 RepID=UPI0031F7F03F
MKNIIIKYNRLCVVLLILLLSVKGYSQKLVKGRIVNDVNGRPIESVNVSVENKGDKKLLISDRNGNFSFVFGQNGSYLKIHISAVGFSKVDTVFGSKHDFGQDIIFRLKQTDIQLEVVDVNVSTGYQSIPKERSTGSFSYIDKRKLDEQVSTDILNKLDGTISGTVFDRTTGSSPRISIRGLSTLQPSMNTPLIVLDNFPYEGDINNINPNDVENITILKDAAASSIWGAKAANGVIVITTKKGKLNQPVKVEVTANTTVIGKPNLFSRQRMSSSEFIDVEQMLYSKGFYDNDINSESRPVLSPVVELLINRESATSGEVVKIDQQIDALRKQDVRDDFDKYVYKTGLNQQYALSMNGGSSSVGWNALIGSDINMDNLGNKYKRVNMRYQNSVVLSKSLRLNSNLMFTKSGNSAGRQDLNDVTSKGGFLYPYAKLADENGNSLALPRDWRSHYIDTLGMGKLLDWKYYPLDDYKSIDQSGDISDILATAGVNYGFLKWFHLDMLYQYEQQTSGSKNLRNSDSYFARNLVNGYTQIDARGNAVRKIPEGGVLDYQDERSVSHNWRGQLSFDRKTEKHLVSAILGAEIRQSTSFGHTNRSYGFDPNTMTSGTVDYTTSYPNLITGATQYIDNGITSNERNVRFVSLYGNVAYTYMDRYTISASARRDASNLFGFKTNDRWNPLWSSGLSWQLSKESFYMNSDIGRFVPYLKARATFGYSGNIHSSLAAVTTIRYRGNSLYTQMPYASFDKFANPELKWETTGMLNLGLDFVLKNNRISGSIEYYQKKSSDLFANVPIDYTGGIGSTAVKNAAKMKAWGWDLVLNSINIDHVFKWKTEINLSLNRDKITKYYLASDRGSNFMLAIPTVSGVEGKPVYSVLSYKWAGLDPLTGAPRGYVDGEVSSEYTEITGSKTTVNDLVYHGSASPTFFGSLGNTFSWKDFSASVRIQYKFDYFFRKQTISYNSLYANWDGNSDYSRRWTQPGDESRTNVPAMTYPASVQSEAFYQFAEPFVLKADHIRLQYINVSYRFKKNSLQRLPFEQLKIYITANNLGILWRANKEGLDPDYSYNALMLEPSKTWGAGIQVTF